MKRLISIILVFVILFTSHSAAFLVNASGGTSNNYTFTSIDEKTVYIRPHESEVTVLIFGVCYSTNTKELLNEVANSDWVNCDDIRTIFVDCSDTYRCSKSDVMNFANTIDKSDITYCYDSNGGNQSYSAVSRYFGSTTGSPPMVVLLDYQNSIQYTSQNVSSQQVIINKILEFADVDYENPTANIKVSGQEDYDYAFEVLEHINTKRQAKGLSKLTMDSIMIEGAMQRAAEAYIYMNPIRPNGEKYYTVCNWKGSIYGGLGYPGNNTTNELATSWTNNYNDLLSSKYTSIGIGCFIDENGFVSCSFLLNDQVATTVSKTGKKAVIKTINITKSKILLEGDLSKTSINATGSDKSQMDVYLYHTDAQYDEFAKLHPSSLNYTSSNPSIASVDENGIITGHLNGTATITATIKDDSSIFVSKTITTTGGVEEKIQYGLDRFSFGQDITGYVGDVIDSLVVYTSVNENIASLDISSSNTNVVEIGTIEIGVGDYITGENECMANIPLKLKAKGTSTISITSPEGVSESVIVTVSNVPEVEKSIAIFTTEKSLSLNTGDSMWLAFGLINVETGLVEDDWRKMAITLSDPTIVSLSDYKETEYGYSLEVIGKKEGATNVTITDTETGINTIFVISVHDSFVQTYSYEIDSMNTFYPNNRFEDHIATNIYDLNGMYVNNYSAIKNTDGSYTVTFDVYNSKYYYGAVDIYDENGMWLGFEEIEKYSDIDSVWDTGVQTFYLISECASSIASLGKESNLLTYQQASFSRKTRIEISVPENGYFTISNNISESPGTYVVNSLEILFDAAFTVLEAATSGVNKVSAFDDILKQTKKTFAQRLIDARNESLKNEVKRKAQKVMLNSMQSKIKNITKKCAKEDIIDQISVMSTASSELAGLLESSLFAEYEINWKSIFESTFELGEAFFTKFSGPAGMALQGCFAITKGTNKLLMVSQLAWSSNEPYVSIYSNVEEGYINPYGVVINTAGNMDAEAVLQVFRVSNDDAVDVILNSNNPLEKHELYNISFVKDDQLVQPSGKVTVHIPIPEGMNGNTCKVYRQESDGAWTILDAHIEGNYLVFETDHFSLYSVVGDMDSFRVHSLPNKAVYTDGDALDTTGLVLNMNGELISEGFICDPTVLVGVGNKQITVQYGKATTNFEVRVEAPKPTAKYTVEADKNIAHPGDTITYAVYLQQTGAQNSVEFTIKVPEGLSYVANSAAIPSGINSMLNWTGDGEGVSWTEQSMIYNGFGSKSFTETEKVKLLTFKCVVDDNAAYKDYNVELIDLVADDSYYKTKNPIASPATVTVTKETVTPSSVTVVSNPSKTTYYIGDTLNTSGLNLKLTYSDGSTKTITSGFTTSGFSSTSAGTKTVTVSYEGKTTTFNVTVKTPIITLSPTSKTLTIGDSSNITATTTPSGQSVTWTSSNTSVATVSNGTITAKAAGSATITVKFTYNGNTYSKTCSVTVNPEPVVISSIEIITKPSKTTYYIGDTLNTSGLNLKLTYNDGSTKTITTGFTTSGFDSTTTGTKTITVNYQGFTDTFSVVIKSSEIYYIYTVNDLIAINDDLSGNYILMNDIDLSSIENWEPIGESIEYWYDKMQTGFTEVENGNYFTGTLDGNGYTIKNLTINSQPEEYYNSTTGETVNAYGLFSHISGAEIKNLTFTDVNVNISVIDDTSGKNFTKRTIAAVIGASAKNATISNCDILSGTFNLENGTYSGGAVAIDLGDCTYNAMQNNISHLGGGIVGACDHIGTIIKNCVNKGDYAGITGGGCPTILNCYNFGITTTGGIIGRAYSYTDNGLNIENCVNFGDVICTTNDPSVFVGGIIGELDIGRGMLTLRNCVNYGNLYVSTIDKEGGYISGVGGIAGSIDVNDSSINHNITNCVNYGKINIDLSECISDKSINVAGICGDHYGLSVNVERIFNYGDIEILGSNSNWFHISGLIGYGSVKSLSNSANHGNIIANNSNHDHLFFSGIADIEYEELKNISNTGNIEVSGQIEHLLCGGISRSIYTSPNIKNVYNIGNINVVDESVSEDDNISLGGITSVLLPQSSGSIITNSYNIGEINLLRDDHAVGSINIGSVYGANPKGTQITLSNYYTTQNSIDKRYGNGDLEVLDSITVLDDFSKESAFKGFDFSETWTLENGQYPTLINAKFEDNTTPTILTNITNNISSSQKITLQAFDNMGITGYYWGTNSAPTTYTSVTSTNELMLEKTVSNPGTYYLITKDAEDNIKTTSVTFYKMTFNVNGGSVTPSSVLARSSNTVALPKPTKSGYTFLGWSTSSTATSADYKPGASFTINSNVILYAVWQKETTLSSISVQNNPTKLTYYIGDTFNISGLVVKLNYSNGTSSNITSGFTTSGFSSTTAGTKTVTVSYAGFTDTFTVTVKKPSLTLSRNDVSLKNGNTVTLSVVSDPNNEDVNWTSSDTSIATVSNGVITAKKAGTTTITAKFTYNGIEYSDVCTVSCIVPVGLEIDKLPDKTVFYVGDCFDRRGLKTKMLYSDGSYESDWGVTSTSLDQVSVFLSEGTRTVIVYNGSYSTSYTIEVKPLVANLLTNELCLNVGNTHQIEFETSPGDMSQLVSAKWTSSNRNVATVDENGVVKAVGVGTAEITLKIVNGACSTTSNTCMITVDNPIESISIKSNPAKTDYYIGDLLDDSGLELLVTYEDGSTETVTNDFITSGFSSTSSGTKTVTVTYQGYTDTFTVTVKTPSITLSSSSKTMSVGDSSAITATTTPSGQTVTWTSSNTSVATVSGGIITAKASGTTIITAKFTYNGKTYSKTCSVTVSEVVPDEPTPTSLLVSTKPTKTIYEIGESLNTSGLKLKLTYSDGSTETITNGFTTSGFSSTTAGTKTVTVKYSDLSTTFTVTVIHTHDYTSSITKKPSCTSTGVRNYTCSSCGDSYTETISATGHDWDSATCEEPKTCTKCGITSGGALGHDYNARTTKNPTCTESGIKTYTCIECGDVYTKSISALGHDYDSGVVTTKATCKATGIKIYTCNDCGATKTSTIAKLTAHTYSNNCDKSCNVCGKTRTIGAHKYSNSCDTTCNYCNAKRTIKHTYSNNCDTACNVCKAKRTIKHTYSNNCDTSCNVCKATRTITHSYKTTTTKATLTKSGSILKKCSVCGKVVSNTAIKYAKTFKLSATSYTYNGKAKTPSVTVKDSAGKTLKKNTDYTVTYASGRKNVGTYKVTIKMIGKYSGTKTLTFKINPAKTTVSKLTAGKKSITVAITKKSTQVTGYQIQYSTSKKFTNAKTKTISSYKTTKYTLKSLSSKKIYYVRVRTYKKVGSTIYYSGWSTYKYVKTK